MIKTLNGFLWAPQILHPLLLGGHLHAALGLPGRGGPVQVQLLREGRGRGGGVQPGRGLRHRAGPQRPLSRVPRELAGKDHDNRRTRENRGTAGSEQGGRQRRRVGDVLLRIMLIGRR